MTLNDIINLDVDIHLRNAFRVYGIEGTEQKIKEIMQGALQEFMLERYGRLINAR